MTVQPPSEPPKLPYESTFTAIINLIKDRPLSGVGLLCALIFAALLLASVPLGWPAYALLGVGALLLCADILVWLRQQRKGDEKGTNKGEERKPEDGTVTLPGERPTPDALRDDYLKSLIHECCRARLVGLDPQAADPTQGGRLSLERLYVALDTLTRVEEEPGQRSRKEREALEAMEQEKPPLSALQALTRAPESRMVLVRLPGSGKSTLVRYLALRMAQALRDPALSLADLLPGWTGRPLLPLIVPLGRLAESIPSTTPRGDARMVERFVRQTLDAVPELQGYGDALLATIRREGGLVLFDGLDEVANLNLRPLVRQAVEDFADAYGRSGAARFMLDFGHFYTPPHIRVEIGNTPIYRGQIALQRREIGQNQ